MKFQTQTAEEKEAWIKALRDGINRAKNKVFDEVNICVICTQNQKCPLISVSGIVTEFEYVLIVFPLDFFVAVVL